MKRKFAYIGFSYLLGLTAFAINWGKYTGTLIILALIWIISGLFCLKKHRIYVLVCGLTFFIGIIYAESFTYFHYDKIMSYDNQKVVIKGYIKDYTYSSSDRGMLTVKGKINDGETTEISFWYDNDDYEYYDEIEIVGTVTAIKNSIDYQSKNYFKSKGIYLRGKNVEKITFSHQNNHPILKAIKEYRDYMFNMINDIVGGQEGAMLSAMLCGDKSEMNITTRNALYKTGLGHIFAVSGTHLMVIVTFFLVIFKRFSLSRKLRVALTTIVVWAFVVFAGFSPSVVRAAIMATLILLSQLIKRESDCLNTLGLCCILLTIGNPYIIRNPSFALSMAGAFGLGVVAPYISQKIKYHGIFKKTIESFISVISMFLVSLPVFILFFNEISIIGPLANIFLLPICTLAISMTVLVVITGGVDFIAIPILKTAGILIKFVLDISEKVSSIEYMSIVVSEKNLKIILVIICLIGFLLMVLLKNTKNRILISLAVYLSFICVYNVHRMNIKDEMHIIIIHDDKVSQILMYQNTKGIIMDFNAKGKHNYAIQQFCENRNIFEVNALITNKEPYHTTIKYKYGMLPKPQQCIGDFDEIECKADRFLINSDSYDFNGVEITWDKNGYNLNNTGIKLSINKKDFVFNDITYKFGNDDFIYDIVGIDNHYEVRRLDYGINE